jgi:hypothetical protein
MGGDGRFPTKPKTEGEETMKIETNVKADELSNNQSRCVKPGMKVKSSVKAGALTFNHNQTVARGLKVKSGVKAGVVDPNS